MEALLYTYHEAESATEKSERIFVPVSGEQSQLWWQWSCVNQQQTLFRNLLGLYACAIIEPLRTKSVTLSVTATLTEADNTRDGGRIFVFERQTKVDEVPPKMSLLFCTKEQCVDLLRKLDAVGAGKVAQVSGPGSCHRGNQK